jgi:transcriptional regulator with XRE-family HTH domain
MDLQLRRAEYIWGDMIGLNKFDEAIDTPSLNKIEVPSVPKTGWLATSREGLQLSQGEMASRLGITRQAYTGMESSEVAGTLTLQRLQMAAQEMDCELVYFLRPRQRKSFAKLIWEQIFPEALKIYKFRRHQNPIRPTTLAAIARDLFNQTEFRRAAGWVRKSDDV